MKIGIFIFAIIAVAVGLIAAAHHGLYGITLDSKIKPYEVLNLAVAIIIAVVLQYHLAGKSRDSRVEKDIIISNIKEVIQQMRQFRDLISQHHDGKPISDQSKRDILAALRKMSNELLNVEFVVETSNCTDATEACRLLQNDLRVYKMAVTGGKFPAGYGQTDISAQEKAYRYFHRKLHSLLFRINTHR